MNKLYTIDLFAGCGGLSEGFLSEGHFSSQASVEWEEAQCATLANRLKTVWNKRNADEAVIRFDVRRTNELLYGYDDPQYGQNPGLIKLVGNKHISVIIGGPPCQAYSLAGRIRDEHGMKNDYRNYLFESYIKIVKYFSPDYFVFENVIGLLSAAPDGTPIINKIREAFDKAGYSVLNDFKDALFDVADLGLPQHRKRVIILGVRRKNSSLTERKRCDAILADFYDSLHHSYYNGPHTVWQAIKDLPKMRPLNAPIKEKAGKFSHEPISTKVPNHIPRFHSERDIKVFSLLTSDIESGQNKYTHIEQLKKLYTKITGKTSNIHKYYVLRKNEPSNTIPAHLYKDGLRHIHPDPKQARTITVREAARLQTFPDDFVFLGSMSSQYQMIGNAVPVAFAKMIAQSLYKVIKKYRG